METSYYHAHHWELYILSQLPYISHINSVPNIYQLEFYGIEFE